MDVKAQYSRFKIGVDTWHDMSYVANFVAVGQRKLVTLANKVDCMASDFFTSDHHLSDPRLV